MTEAEALARLQAMTAWDSDPALSFAEVEMLLDIAKRADADDLLPADDDWSPTWDLNAAAAEGWRWKAAKAAGRYSLSTDGQSLNRSDIIAHCQQMADQYRKKIVYSVGTTGAWTEA